jgi:hypothetical protein
MLLFAISAIPAAGDAPRVAEVAGDLGVGMEIGSEKTDDLESRRSQTWRELR